MSRRASLGSIGETQVNERNLRSNARRASIAPSRISSGMTSQKPFSNIENADATPFHEAVEKKPTQEERSRRLSMAGAAPSRSSTGRQSIGKHSTLIQRLRVICSQYPIFK